jgi:cytochrome c biogenesis protein
LGYDETYFTLSASLFAPDCAMARILLILVNIMAAAEETTTNALRAKAETKSDVTAPTKAGPSLLTRLINLLSSVKFGVVMLCLLAAFCLIGMLVMQQDVEGFDKYYSTLAPAQRALFARLGIFDIYHVWYFNATLLILSLNIILASIDRFPKAWTFISQPKLDASPHWLKGQEQSAELNLRENGGLPALSERIAAACKSVGLKNTVISEKKGKTFVFAQTNAWNRLGAYAVHVALLTIFLGGFMTARYGVTGSMPLQSGMVSSKMSETKAELDQPVRREYDLPFEVECLDIQQKLIRKDGPITANNTLDWLTRVKIRDPQSGATEEALVHMNQPYDYRGYRFFQASFIPSGKARNITVQLTPEKGGAAQEIKLGKDTSYETTLADGTKIKFADFRAAFSVGPEEQNMDTSDYPNPAAVLLVTTPEGKAEQAFAFTPEMAEKAPFAKQPKAGYTYRLADFEKVADAHILSIQRDPGSNIVYLGFGLLGLTLCAVFFFSHQRVWAAVEPQDEGEFKVTLGGNVNRSRLAFEEKFKRLVSNLNGEATTQT